MMPDLTGMSADDALRIMKKNGVEGQVHITSAPTRNASDSIRLEKGETRVICVRGSTVIAARFLVCPQEN